MWLILNTLKLEGPQKKQTSRVQKSRINMDMVISYFDAPDEIKNHERENLRANTFMMIDLEGKCVFSVMETVEQIDDMIACYGVETSGPEANKPKIEIEKETLNRLNENNTGGWGKPGW